MPNRLQYETSPYLLQHARNPVDWYPWGDEAFNRAKEENKPVLVSIGYAACHWCHVMEHESFEDEQVAAIMNGHFINIKVDREEHPDVDHFYMDALQAMSGAGGWPLNMFVTPDRKPFYGGTYFPPERVYGRASWSEVLEAVHISWQEKNEEVQMQADQMTSYLEHAGLIAGDTAVRLDKNFTKSIAENILQQADGENGGFSMAPKFPATMSIQYLLDFSHFQKNEEALETALLCLNKMIDGGIYDQLGGGFARYATDNSWLIPHFEKMLYDNALLISVLSQAFKLTNDPKLKNAVVETINFCERELGAGNHLWYAALDADSEGKEGKFYTWTYEEIKNELSSLHPAIKAFWGIEENGNWEERNILHVAQNEKEVQAAFNLSREEWLGILTEARQKLFVARAKRTRPATDFKVILSWNALMIMALIDAGKALQQHEYIVRAQQAADKIIVLFTQNTQALYHVYTNGKPGIDAKLDDYAYFIKALLMLYAETSQEQYLKEAQKWLQYVIENFSDSGKVFFYFSSQAQKDIPVRKIDTYDGATPSANAIMSYNLWTIGNLSYDFDLIERAEVMLQRMSGNAFRYPVSFAQWSVYMQYYAEGWKQLIVRSKERDKTKINNRYMPQIYSVVYTEQKEMPQYLQSLVTNEDDMYLLCEKGSCNIPQKTLEEIF